jgi:diguanylate cyclase (GGDEF)-like protein
MEHTERFISVPAKTQSAILLASHDPLLLSTVEPVLLATGAKVDIVLSLEAALDSISSAQPPTLSLLDVSLPALDPRMNIERLLGSVRADEKLSGLPIILIADTVTQTWINRLAEGVIDDLILRTSDAAYWQLRIELVRRQRDCSRELEILREAQALHARTDHLTGVYNRETILAMLFRETDRLQRMNGTLSVVLLDIDDFGHWNSRLGNEACDNLLCQVVGRVARLLRSYDLLGRAGKDEFLAVLPGCSALNASQLAERMRLEVFSSPFHVGSEAIRLSACYGIASSQGRSPVVVLREAETALGWARTAGPESIQCFGDSPLGSEGPVTFLSPSSGDELLAW